MKSTTLVVLFALLGLGLVFAFEVPSPEPLSVEFGQWMKQHGKTYATDEFQYRWQVWKDNAEWIRDFNLRNESFKVSMNQFGDLTSFEFGRIYNGLLRIDRTVPEPEEEELPEAPSSVDWRTKGVVTGVKNQACGSCWAFSTTGSLEGAHALHTGTLVSLSEQNLVDCSTSEGNEGCNGGLMDYAFQYVITNNGVDTERSYPYTAEDGNCVYKRSNCGSTLKAFKDVQSGSEASLQVAVGTIGPVSVAIDASHSSFQFYSSGVYYEPNCSPNQLDHGVLAVGYDADSSGKQYWIVKNSWGTDWGMKGYIWMSRNRNNNCGIATAASYPISAGAGTC